MVAGDLELVVLSASVGKVRDTTLTAWPEVVLGYELLDPFDRFEKVS